MNQPLDDTRDQLRDAASQTTILRLAFIGLTDGLLEALDQAATLSSDELADRTDTDPTYVARWLDAAYGFELVDTDDDTFELTELGEAFLPDVPGTMMPLAIQSVLSARLADRLADLLRSGEQPGEAILGEFENVTPWFGRMLEAKFRPYFEGNVLPELEIFEQVDAESGRILDLGCGNGWYLRALLEEFEGLSGVGIDLMPESIRHARTTTAEDGLEGRLDFREADLTDFRTDEPFDVVVLNRTFHHVWEDRDEVFETAAAALADGGHLIAWEPAWPDGRDGLRDSKRRMLGMRNLAEHAMGNRLLTPDELRDAFEAHDFDTDIRRLDAIETLIVGRHTA
jgi:SAM-dependent methyltransferase